MKMKKVAKLLAPMLAVAMSVGLLAGCGSTETGKEESKKEESKKEESKQEDKQEEAKDDFVWDGSLPLTDEEGITLTIACQTGWAGKTPITDDEWTQKVFENTGIKIEVELIDAASYGDTMSPRLAAGQNIPDIIQMPGTDTTLQYVKSGLILDLTEYYENSTYMKPLLESYGTESLALTGDGKLYYCPWLNHYNGGTFVMSVNLGFLETVGKEIPTTTDELLEVLRAFKDYGDLNGDGEVNEIPMVVLNGWREIAGAWALPLQGGNLNPFFTEDGGMELVATQDQFKSYLEFMNTLYEEDLINKDYLTITEDMAASYAAKNDIGVLLHYMGYNWNWYTEVAGGADKLSEGAVMMPIVQVQAPDALGDATYYGAGFSYAMYGVSSQCKYPELAFRLLDWAYSEEWTLSSVYGPMGETWDYNEEGKPVLIGEYAESKDWVTERRSSFVDNSWVLPCWGEKWNGSTIVEKNTFGTNVTWWSEVNAADSPIAGNYQLPLAMTYASDEQTAILEMYQETLNTHINETMAKFISGERSLDEWDDFQAELEEMGINEIANMYKANFGAK